MAISEIQKIKLGHGLVPGCSVELMWSRKALIVSLPSSEGGEGKGP